MILTPIAGPATITIAPMMPDQEAGPPVYDGKAIKIDWSLGCTIFAYGPFEIQVDGESGITFITIGYKKKDLEQNIQSNDDIRNSPRPSSSTSNLEEPSPENPEAQSQQVRGAAASGEEAATPPHI
ncbi:hypothetical protein AJ80_10068 [Polytolypa hystricis UAMH7299]|uniref:Uncharacterized protein n=1 Tax=Polytolypa hystricis (strain UAMH7299) TaxID=1447883 RepID=A0A2B7W640_POLH7|nr:hypothetical protein AJ80_10068 [Polytolypa hystricis UAMH7299]